MATNIVVDVEADGPCPGLYSMISLGAVAIRRGGNLSFGLRVKPISDKFDLKAMAVCGIDRATHQTYDDPAVVMPIFRDWLKEIADKPVMWSDNPAFDWQFVNYYFHCYCGENPFGHSARRIGDLYCGLKKNLGVNREWKKLRKTAHTHDPVDDAAGNAEALVKIIEMMKP